jgi:hypothetical protein
MGKIATAIEKSANSKIAAPGEFCSTTYATVDSCPRACPLKGAKACYGNIGNLAFQWKRLAGCKSPEKIARTEAKAILGLTGKYPLRIHTLGDCRTTEAVRIVSLAAMQYMSRFGQPAWTYTHAWRNVNRDAWGTVSVLASCETTDEVKQAAKRGYASLLIVPEYETNCSYMVDGLKLVPCPRSTGEAKSCLSCRLCLDDSRLLRIGLTIAIEAHGPSLRVKEVLARKAKG